MSNEYDEPIMISVPIHTLASIHDIAESIVRPLVVYDKDPLEMAKRVIESNARQASLILERLPKNSAIQLTT